MPSLDVIWGLGFGMVVSTVGWIMALWRRGIAMEAEFRDMKERVNRIEQKVDALLSRNYFYPP